MDLEKISKNSGLVQMVKFGLVGATSTVLDMGTLNLLVILFDTNVYLAATAGFVVGTINGYYWNRKWTFGIKSNKNFMARFVRFALIGGMGLLFNNGLLYLFIEYAGLHYNVAKIIAVFIIFFWNFTMNRLWTFHDIKAESNG